MSFKIGAQYYTIRDYCQTLEDFDKSCKRIKDIGYEKIQLSGIGNFSCEEIKPVLDKYGLTVICTHRPWENYINNIEEEIKFHKTIGCDVCGIGVMPGFDGTLSAIEAFGKNFTPVCKKLAENNLIFAYHNHSFEFTKINGKYAFDLICESIKSDNFKLIADVYWLAYSGINPSKFIREYKEKIACVHFKDLKITEKNEVTYAEVGYGNLDWGDIILACKEAKIEEYLVEQDNSWKDNNPFLSLELSYDFLRTKGFN